jgi:hypothetical protein
MEEEKEDKRDNWQEDDAAIGEDPPQPETED